MDATTLLLDVQPLIHAWAAGIQESGPVARGLSNRDIGRQLYVSQATVKTHLLRIYAKLGVDDRTAAVTVALERGIIRLPG